VNYEHICFVIMPYGEKVVALDGTRTVKVNFDRIYQSIFEPAIAAVGLPEGGQLEPRRCDQDFFSAIITQDMFEYIEYARMALADISGLNANAFYELGVRHRARPSGTVIVRLTSAPIPFDIKQIKAFAYDYEPDAEAELARKNISQVLDQTLKANRLDSPVQQALRAQQGAPSSVDDLLREAENMIRVERWSEAGRQYEAAIKRQPRNWMLRMKLGLMYKEQGAWDKAREQFDAAAQLEPNEAALHRESGLAANKLAAKLKKDDLGAGAAELQRAIELDPDDFDALACLGGIRKRQKRFQEASDLYRRSTEVSRGHSYPLLNWIKLQAKVTGQLVLDDRTKFLLNRAERVLRSNTAHHPPIDPPWSFFDLAECRLLRNDAQGFLEAVEAGLEVAGHRGQATTFRDSLALLVDSGLDLPGLKAGLALIEQREPFLP
jgi:tetratricopeptide (TPR) repeat protein